MHVEIERREPGAIQVFTYDSLPRVPEWILISLDPGKHPFWTLPAGHFFEGTEGEIGLPGDLQDAARRYAAGEIDQAAAEALITETLAAWSRATSEPE